MNKIITSSIERVAKVFGCAVDCVTVEFSTRIGWVVRVETAALDMRSRTGRTRKTLPDVSSGVGPTLRQAEADVIRRVRFHRIDQIDVVRERLRSSDAPQSIGDAVARAIADR